MTIKIAKAAAAAGLVFTLAAPAAAAVDAARAQELLNAKGCKGCHKLGGSGGTLGPALDGVGKRMKEKDIRDQLVNPKARNAKSMMPAYGQMGEKDLKVLVDYLKGLK